MLSSEITVYDFVFVMIMISNVICLYAGYRWGHSDCEKEMQNRIIRQIKREMILRK